MVLGPQGPGRVGRRRCSLMTGRPAGRPVVVVLWAVALACRCDAVRRGGLSSSCRGRSRWPGGAMRCAGAARRRAGVLGAAVVLVAPFAGWPCRELARAVRTVGSRQRWGPRPRDALISARSDARRGASDRARRSDVSASGMAGAPAPASRRVWAACGARVIGAAGGGPAMRPPPRRARPTWGVRGSGERGSCRGRTESAVPARQRATAPWCVHAASRHRGAGHARTASEVSTQPTTARPRAGRMLSRRRRCGAGFRPGGRSLRRTYVPKLGERSDGTDVRRARSPDAPGIRSRGRATDRARPCALAVRRSLRRTASRRRAALGTVWPRTAVTSAAAPATALCPCLSRGGRARRRGPPGRR